VAATLGGGALLRMAWQPNSSTAYWGRGAIAAGLAYGGNVLVSDKSPDEIKEIVRNRAVALLASKGLSADEINQAFDLYYGDEAVKKPSFWRNIGNQAMTVLGSGVGLGIVSVIAGKIAPQLTESFDVSGTEVSILKTDNIGGKALAGVSGLLGGYLGNKAWQGPSQKAIDERSLDIVTKILSERKPVAEMSQVEALQQRDSQRAQTTENQR
jgi:hypothetical protein